MKLNKSAYLFAAALVAGTMGMTSCSNEEIIDDAAVAGTENTVTLSMSVADKFGTRSTADEVNLGTSMSDIQNIWVVPMIGDTRQNPISMGTLSPGTDKTKSVEKKTTLNSRVDGFKIYGNVTPDEGFSFNESAVAQNFTVTVGRAKAGEQDLEINNVPMYNPHGLYYYGVAKAGTQVADDPVGKGNIYVGAAANPSTVLGTGETIGENTYVKVDGVDYAVGVLAAAILNGDKTTPVFSSNSDESVIADDYAYNHISVSGIIINNQKLKLDQDFKHVGGESGTENVGAIYEEVATGKGAFATSTLSNGSAANGNLYVVVTETAANENVSANIEFTLAQGYYIKVGDNQYIGSADSDTKFYLPVSLKPETTGLNRTVFMKDYSTILNATVKNWGLASKTPVEVTDVNLAVEIDLNWRSGIVYDQDI